jgi:predicted glycosyltransferase involved in capsule biosynthesis
VDWAGLRGFLVHRAQGVCVWLRRDVFDGIGGLDERYEGWGKEDMDLLL